MPDINVKLEGGDYTVKEPEKVSAESSGTCKRRIVIECDIEIKDICYCSSGCFALQEAGLCRLFGKVLLFDKGSFVRCNECFKNEKR